MNKGIMFAPCQRENYSNVPIQLFKDKKKDNRYYVFLNGKQACMYRTMVCIWTQEDLLETLFNGSEEDLKYHLDRCIEE